MMRDSGTCGAKKKGSKSTAREEDLKILQGKKPNEVIHTSEINNPAESLIKHMKDKVKI